MGDSGARAILLAAEVRISRLLPTKNVGTPRGGVGTATVICPKQLATAVSMRIAALSALQVANFLYALRLGCPQPQVDLILEGAIGRAVAECWTGLDPAGVVRLLHSLSRAKVQVEVQQVRLMAEYALSQCSELMPDGIGGIAMLVGTLAKLRVPVHASQLRVLSAVSVAKMDSFQSAARAFSRHRCRAGPRRLRQGCAPEKRLLAPRNCDCGGLRLFQALQLMRCKVKNYVCFKRFDVLHF